MCVIYAKEEENNTKKNMIGNSYLIITANRFLGFVRYIQYKPTMDKKYKNRVRNQKKITPQS